MALLGCALLSVVAIASAIAPCAPRCGCNGGPALAVRHHKSGTVLAQKMMVSLERACGMKTAKLPFRDVGAFAASASGCETAYTYLPASRCNDSCVDAAFAAALDGHCERASPPSPPPPPPPSPGGAAAAPARPRPPSPAGGDGWACATCTYENPGLFLACEVCGQERAGRSPHLGV